jgi:ABC-type cobalamin/Fe3+-siderophores transport system ATPase subunit
MFLYAQRCGRITVEEAWRFVAIMGQSGSGKSALLDVLADVESADAGGNAAAIIEPYKYELTRSDVTFQTVSVLSGQKDMSYGIWSYDTFGQGRSSSRRLLASCHVFRPRTWDGRCQRAA